MQVIELKDGNKVAPYNFKQVYFKINSDIYRANNVSIIISIQYIMR